MAITFPRSIPDEFRILASSFVLQPMIEVTPVRNGGQVSADLGPSLWSASVRSAQLTMDRIGVVRAWYNTLQSIETFWGFDYYRQFPYEYRRTHFAGLTVGGNPYTGLGRLTAVASNSKQISLDELPNGFVITAGDYVSWDYASGTKTALHQFVQTVTLPGGSVTEIEVRPHVRTGWSTNQGVRMHRPAARMIIVPGSYQETIERGLGVISCQAIQVL